IAVAQQYRDGVGPGVADRQIQLAVAIHVAHDHGGRIRAYIEGSRRPEGPIAVAQQYRDGVGPGVADRQIRFAVAIHIAHGDGPRIETNPVERRRLEGSVAVAQRSEEHTSELQSRVDLVCRLLLEKKKRTVQTILSSYHDSMKDFGDGANKGELMRTERALRLAAMLIV